MTRNTNNRNNKAQSAHIKIGKVIKSPFDFGLKECAINPCMPKLNSRKIRLEVIIKKLLENDSFATKREIPNASAIKITILNILLVIL